MWLHESSLPAIGHHFTARRFGFLIVMRVGVHIPSHLPLRVPTKAAKRNVLHTAFISFGFVCLPSPDKEGFCLFSYIKVML